MIMQPESKGDKNKVYLEDEEAINRMLKEIENQGRGKL